MAFFRKWKAHYKHKKFKSEDAADDGEDLDWGLKSCPSASSNSCDLEHLKIDSIDADCKTVLEGKLTDDNSSPPTGSYNLKYLGCTGIEDKRSEKIVADAVKIVIDNSKAGGRKRKSQRSVTLKVLRNGVEVVDPKTQDQLMRFSIYDISYCSVVAAHDHAFAFVGAEEDPLSPEVRLSCHVFQAPKRKVAYEITLTMARCFEQAYQHWRDVVVRQMRSHSTGSSSGGGGVCTGIVASESKQLIEVEHHGNHHLASGQSTQNWISFDDDDYDDSTS